MNRQIRRAQAKQEKKVEQEKVKKKEARQERIQEIKERRERRRAEARTQVGVSALPKDRPLTEAERKKAPGRFSGALMIATVFFIVLQVAVPDPQASIVTSLTGAGFFLLFGYFSTLYLSRRGGVNALVMTVISGLALAVGVLVARLVTPGASVDWLMSGLGLVGVVGGAYLGRMVFYAARP